MKRRSVKYFSMICLSLVCLAWAQPAPNPEAARQLVELIKVAPQVRLDVRYASKNNFMGQVLYPQARIFVRPEVGEALKRVQHRVDRRGFQLLVFDGYRPWRVTKMMWDKTPPEKRDFVADPAKGSRHNRGGAVDLSLWDTKRGKPVEMPSGYDDFSPRAAFNFSGGTSRSRANRDFLRHCMEAEGFQVYPEEWWHFDYKGWKDFPLLDYSFDELDAL